MKFLKNVFLGCVVVSCAVATSFVQAVTENEKLETLLNVAATEALYLEKAEPLQVKELSKLNEALIKMLAKNGESPFFRAANLLNIYADILKSFGCIYDKYSPLTLETKGAVKKELNKYIQKRLTWPFAKAVIANSPTIGHATIYIIFDALAVVSLAFFDECPCEKMNKFFELSWVKKVDEVIKNIKKEDLADQIPTYNDFTGVIEKYYSTIDLCLIQKNHNISQALGATVVTFALEKFGSEETTLSFYFSLLKSFGLGSEINKLGDNMSLVFEELWKSGYVGCYKQLNKFIATAVEELVKQWYPNEDTSEFISWLHSKKGVDAQIPAQEKK